MQVLSLFSGIGAFEKALNRLDVPYELIGFSEIDKYAIKSYCAVHGVDESLNLGDITEIDTSQLPNNIDLITYGFPCQDISIAGKRKGMTDESGEKTRSGLFFDALRIIKDTQPKIAIAENVKNLTSIKFSDQFETVLKSLEEAGYNNYWRVLNANEYGIPQNRERVFIVSIRKDIDNGLFEFPKPFKLQLMLKDLLEDDVDEKYYYADHITDCFTTIPLEKHNTGDCLQIGDLRHYKNDQMNRVYSIEGCAPCLLVKTGGGREIKILVKNKRLINPQKGVIIDDTQGFDGVRVYDNIAPSLRASRSGLKTITNDYRVRKLTPLECWRIMGFDDDDFYKAEKQNSNTQLFKQAGNSIVINVAEKILEKIFKDKV